MKVYASPTTEEQRRYSPAKITKVEKASLVGNPNMDKVSTSYVERSNLTIRMTNRRFTRLTNGFSKEIENHCHELALTIMAYNFCRKHQTLKQTPAMAAGIADHQWSMDEVVAMIEAFVVAQEAEAFEEAFAAIKWTAPRTSPKTYASCKPLVPWYLDPESGGPNPPLDQRKPGVNYED